MRWNQCSFLGNVGGDVERKQISGGMSVGEFSLHVDGFKKDDAGMWVKGLK